MAASVDFDSLILKEEIKRITLSNQHLVFGFFRENDEINNLNTPEGIINICLLFTFRIYFESSILSPSECEELHKMIGDHRNIYPTEWKLLYKATKDGYKTEDCHPKCYSKERVVVIIESNQGNVFGGFTQVGWKINAKTNDYRADANAFLFLIRSKNPKKKNEIFKIKDEYIEEALYHYKQKGNSWLFLFGRGGTDLFIPENFPNDSNVGSILVCFGNGSDETRKRHLNGHGSCTIKEIEAFQLNS